MTTVDFTPLQGGVPIVVDGAVVGRGRESPARRARRRTRSSRPRRGGVRGAGGRLVLPRAAGSRGLREGLRALRRTGPQLHGARLPAAGAGQAEVHAKDADIIYVLDGSATFVTGGTVVEPKTTAPDEVRGSEIVARRDADDLEGRRPHRPGRTPHWFETVPSVFTYYVVKVRS
jgi:hypothetical protein